jgi:HK97 family phage major capsid protein
MANYFAVPSQYRRDASFASVANDITIGTVAAMAQSLTAPIVPFAYGTAPGEPDRLFGKPFFSSAAMPITYDASARVLVMGAFKYYQIVDRIKQMSITRLNELFAATYQVGFMGGFRTDGKCVMPDAFRTLTLGTA